LARRQRHTETGMTAARQTSGKQLSGRHVGYIFLLMVSAFFCFAGYAELQMVQSIRGWPQHHVEITRSDIAVERRNNNMQTVLKLAVRDLESGEETHKVQLTRGDIAFSISVFDKSVSTTLEEAAKRYPVGTRTIAHRNPENPPGTSGERGARYPAYVLEQNDGKIMHIFIAIGITGFLALAMMIISRL
jgi:hypothetical protein